MQVSLEDGLLDSSIESVSTFGKLIKIERLKRIQPILSKQDVKTA
jgi:hypothetical protein